MTIETPQQNKIASSRWPCSIRPDNYILLFSEHFNKIIFLSLVCLFNTYKAEANF